MELNPDQWLIVKIIGLIGASWGAWVAIRKWYKSVKRIKNKITAILTVDEKLDALKIENKNLFESLEKLVVSHNEDQKKRFAELTKKSSRLDARMRTLMNAIGLYTFEADEHGRWETVNKNFCLIVGYEENDLKGMGWMNVIDRTDRARVYAEYQDAIKQDRMTEIFFKLINRDKKSVEAVMRTQRMICTDRMTFGFFGIVMVTEKQ